MAARTWFEEQRNEGWATCTLTEAGFVRVSCNPTVVRHNITPLDALAVMERLTRSGAHTFWPLDRSILNLPGSITSRLLGYRQVTDAVLLATAIQRNGTLATLDAGMEELVAERDRAFLYVIPV